MNEWTQRSNRQPYSQYIGWSTPACFLFLIDQSLSMEERIAGDGPPKAEQLASAINFWINAMITRASGDAGIKDWMEIAVIGYHTDNDGNPVVGTALGGGLAEASRDAFLKISEFEKHPLRKTEKTQQIYDPETNETFELPTEVHEWVDPVSAGGTPMCHALCFAHRLLLKWVSDHHECFPPIVMHVTDGEATDGDPVRHAEAIRSLATDDGNALIFTCHLSSVKHDSIKFPGNEAFLPDDFARCLFRMSSELPAPMAQVAKWEGYKLQPKAKGFVFNADTVSLLQFIDMGGD